MNNPFPYSKAQFDALLNSDYVTSPTRQALEERINKNKGTNVFFSDYNFTLLAAVCNRLLGQDASSPMVNMALFIDERLANNTCDGWRYANMPPDDEMLTQGLAGIDETAFILYNQKFIELHAEKEDEVLSQIQKGSPEGNVWKTLPADLFFEELLAEATEIFYSYPAVLWELGYVGMADAKGWKDVALNNRNEIDIKT